MVLCTLDKAFCGPVCWGVLVVPGGGGIGGRALFLPWRADGGLPGAGAPPASGVVWVVGAEWLRSEGAWTGLRGMQPGHPFFCPGG